MLRGYTIIKPEREVLKQQQAQSSKKESIGPASIIVNYSRFNILANIADVFCFMGPIPLWVVFVPIGNYTFKLFILVIDLFSDNISLFVYLKN